MIDDWLEKYKSMWITKNVALLSDLFTEDVEYWENPFKKLESFEEIQSEWQAINAQQNINLNLVSLNPGNDLNVVKWDLAYELPGIKSHWSGIYLIRFNQNSKCDYFLQVGEKE